MGAHFPLTAGEGHGFRSVRPCPVPKRNLKDPVQTSLGPKTRYERPCSTRFLFRSLSFSRAFAFRSSEPCLLFELEFPGSRRRLERSPRTSKFLRSHSARNSEGRANLHLFGQVCFWTVRPSFFAGKTKAKPHEKVLLPPWARSVCSLRRVCLWRKIDCAGHITRHPRLSKLSVQDRSFRSRELAIIKSEYEKLQPRQPRRRLVVFQEFGIWHFGMRNISNRAPG